MVFAVGALPSRADDTAPVAAATDLRYFVGSWHCNGTFPATNRPISSDLDFMPDFDGRGAIVHQDDVPPNVYHAVSLWAPASGTRTLNAALQDVTGAVRRFSSEGWSGNVLTWSSALDVSPPQRFRFTRMELDVMRVDWEVVAHGEAYVLGDTLTCKRATRVTLRTL